MEILQFLLNFFLEQYGNGKFKEIFNFLKANNFDVNNALKNIKPENLTPIVKAFMNDNKNSHKENFSSPCGLTPIAKIADKEIVYTLNKYFSC